MECKYYLKMAYNKKQLIHCLPFFAINLDDCVEPELKLRCQLEREEAMAMEEIEGVEMVDEDHHREEEDIHLPVVLVHEAEIVSATGRVVPCLAIVSAGKLHSIDYKSQFTDHKIPCLL